MTLSELEAVQAKMEAKRKATTFSKFNAGEHFLSQPSLAAQPVAASSAQLSSSQSDAAPQHAVGNEGGAADNSLSQQLPASMLDMAHNSNSEAEPKSSLQLPHRQDAAQGSRDYDAVASPLQASYEMQDDSDDNIAAADDEEDVTDAQLMELKVCTLLLTCQHMPGIEPH